MIKRFKNGNMNCHCDLSSYDNRESDLINLLWELEDKDCSILGEEFCLSNYEMGLFVYSWYTDCKYLIRYGDLEEWKAGKTLKLYALPMEPEDREILDREYN